MVGDLWPLFSLSLILLLFIFSAGALVFDPATVTISKGDSVTWTNNAGFPHNIVFDEGELSCMICEEGENLSDCL